MYKLKSKVNFKKLEKYGYEYQNEDGQEAYIKAFEEDLKQVFIMKLDRAVVLGEFRLLGGFYEIDMEEKYIEDLVQANLVRKVKE